MPTVNCCQHPLAQTVCAHVVSVLEKAATVRGLLVVKYSIV